VKDREILRCLGKNIQAARLRAGLTQECLAELVGIHWKTLSGIERGLYPCAVTNFIRIAQHLRVSTDSLVEGIEPPDARRTASIQKAMARKRRPKAV
jgi:DNA-binding XRE family transcriptional regulator